MAEDISPSFLLSYQFSSFFVVSRIDTLPSQRLRTSKGPKLLNLQATLVTSSACEAQRRFKCLWLVASSGRLLEE